MSKDSDPLKDISSRNLRHNFSHLLSPIAITLPKNNLHTKNFLKKFSEAYFLIKIPKNDGVLPAFFTNFTDLRVTYLP